MSWSGLSWEELIKLTPALNKDKLYRLGGEEAQRAFASVSKKDLSSDDTSEHWARRLFKSNKKTTLRSSGMSSLLTANAYFIIN